MKPGSIATIDRLAKWAIYGTVAYALCAIIYLAVKPKPEPTPEWAGDSIQAELAAAPADASLVEAFEQIHQTAAEMQVSLEEATEIVRREKAAESDSQ